MKINAFLIIIGLLISLHGYTQKEVEKSVTKDSANQAKISEADIDLTVPVLPSDYILINLSKIGLDGTATVPKGADIQKSTLMDNEGTRSEYIINAFNVITGDTSLDKYGGISAEIEIFTTGWTLEKHKEYIKNSVIAKWHKLLKEGAEYFIYSTGPVNTWNQPLRGKDKDVYQFLILKKSKKGNKQYCICSNSSYDLAKDEMLRLFAIAKSIDL